jgi:WD40 repeat protein
LATRAALTPNVAGSLDRTVRLWDLSEGMPVSISRPHGGTVRAVALDDTALFSGGSDHLVRLWDSAASLSAAASASAAVPRGGGGGGGGAEPGAEPDLLLLPGGSSDDDEGGGSAGGGNSGGPLFDLSRGERLLPGHIGPITSLSLTGAALYSGSWDTSVRVWQRSDK